MDKLVLMELARELMVCSIFIILVFLFVKIFYSSQSEKRISSFAMETSSNEEISIIDLLSSFFKKIIRFINKLLSKSKIVKRYGERLEKYLLYAGTKFKGDDIVSIKFLIMFLMQIIYLFTCIFSTRFNLYSFLMLSILSFMLLDIIVIIIYHNEKKLIEEQLLQAVVIMNSAFKSGKNITEAIMIVKKELPSPIKDEFEIIYKDISYGLSLNDAFTRFYNRVKLEETKYIAASLSLLSKTGGNIVTVFNMIERNFYDRLKIKNELNALTSTSKFLYRLLMVLPFIFVIIIMALNPAYFAPLFTNTIGIIVLVIMLLLYILYLLLIKRIMKVNEV